MTPAPLRKPFSRYAIVLAIAGAVLFAGGWVSVFDVDEARFALAVREMRERGEWLVPSNWGEPRYHKPILAYWSALAAEHWLGAGERAWRLPSLFAGLLAIAVTMGLASRRWGSRVALAAGAILATTLLFVVEAKILTADALLLGTTSLAFWGWFEWDESRATRWRVLFWVAVALGLLAKGVNVLFLAAAAAARVWLRLAREGRAPRTIPVLVSAGALAASLPGTASFAPVLCALALGWLWWAGRDGRPASRRANGAAWGVPLALALVSTWLVPAAIVTDGDFLRESVGHHLFGRTTQVFEGHAGFPGYYLLTSALVLFPWAAFLPRAVAGAGPEGEFLVAWLLGPWAMLECSASKLPHYVLVCLPAAAILVARELERREREGRCWGGALERTLFVVPALALIVGGLASALSAVPQARLAFAGIAFTAALHLALTLLLTRKPAPARRLFALNSVGALALYAWIGLVVLPAIEPLRLGPRLGRELARVAKPGEAVTFYRLSRASLGVCVPPGHGGALVRAEGEVAAEGLVVLESRRLENFLERHPGHWEQLATASGLEGLDPRGVVVLRGGGGPR